jgi:hypothetical protein
VRLKALRSRHLFDRWHREPAGLQPVSTQLERCADCIGRVQAT